jgi:hypothetical protein
MGRTGRERSLVRPIVIEIPRALEPVARDPFIDGLDDSTGGAAVVELEPVRRPRALETDGSTAREAA